MTQWAKQRRGGWGRPWRWIAGIIALQVLIMAGVYITASLPLYTGTEIRLETRPVDPRSLFRGNYARLSYDISRLPEADVHAAIPRPRVNEKIYVILVPGDRGLYGYGGISATRPEGGVFIRGRLERDRSDHQDKYPVRYGIEAFFAPPDQARNMEKQLRRGAVARIFVSGSGRAALKEVIAHE